MAGEEAVYLIHPKLGGLANELQIQKEKGIPLYTVKSKPFAPLGRIYTVHDESMQEIMRTQQDHTAVFPRHTMYEGNSKAGKLGQIGVIPQNYFIELPNRPKATIRLGVFDSIFKLRNSSTVIAEVAPYRSTWIVVLNSPLDRFYWLTGLAIIYRENTIGS